MLAQNLSTAYNSHPNVKISVFLNLSPTTQMESFYLWAQEHHAPCLPSVSWQSRGILCSPKDRTHFCRDFQETETLLNVRHDFNTLLLCGSYGLEPVSEKKIMAKVAHKLFQQRNTLGCVSGPAWQRKHFGFFHCFSSSFHNLRTNAELKKPKRRKKLATVFSLKVC